MIFVIFISFFAIVNSQQYFIMPPTPNQGTYNLPFARNLSEQAYKGYLEIKNSKDLTKSTIKTQLEDWAMNNDLEPAYTNYTTTSEMARQKLYQNLSLYLNGQALQLLNEIWHIAQDYDITVVEECAKIKTASKGISTEIRMLIPLYSLISMTSTPCIAGGSHNIEFAQNLSDEAFEEYQNVSSNSKNLTKDDIKAQKGKWAEKYDLLQAYNNYTSTRTNRTTTIYQSLAANLRDEALQFLNQIWGIVSDGSLTLQQECVGIQKVLDKTLPQIRNVVPYFTLGLFGPCPMPMMMPIAPVSN